MIRPGRLVRGRRLRGGIVGGGRGAFIGRVHRMAAELDGEAVVVAGSMSADPAVADASALAWYLERSYETYQRMARDEAAHEDGIDFVIIATPNDLHAPVATAFAEVGIHVVCDKPLAHEVDEAESLARVVEKAGVCFALTHPYSAYPAIRDARALVASGALGTLRKVLIEYQQDWLREPIERGGNKQATWRTDPARAGLGGCIGDIGTHAQHLLEFVAGVPIVELCADLTHFVPDRRLDDDANLLLRLADGAKGTLSCSQIATGEENNLTLRLYGSAGGLEWHQQEPNTLVVKPGGAPWQYRRAGAGYMSAAAAAATRTPAGHPEGYIEAFANVYRSFLADVRRAEAGERLEGGYPTVADGVHGMKFIRAAVESAERGSVWVKL